MASKQRFTIDQKALKVMATTKQITKVWIVDGCIVCDACETTAPDVFDVQEDVCVIRPEALAPEFTQPRSESILDAAEECPVDVIKFDTVSVEASKAPAAAPAPAKAAAKPAPKPKAPVADAAAKAPQAGKAPQKIAKASMAGEPDPAIAALLRAATTRGGNAGIVRKTDPSDSPIEAWKKKDPRDLPPDARQAKVLEAAKKVRQDPERSRREFISQAAVTVGWVAFGVGTGVAVGPAFGRFMMPNVLEEPDPRVRLGKLQKYIAMAPGEVNEDYKPQGIWMIREEERIAALSTICTHLGCIPNWLPNDRKFKCPCHGSGYKPNGINFEGPTPRPLERFRIFVEDGLVVVDKSKKYQHELGQWNQVGSFLTV